MRECWLRRLGSRKNLAEDEDEVSAMGFPWLNQCAPLRYISFGGCLLKDSIDYRSIIQNQKRKPADKPQFSYA